MTSNDTNRYLDVILKKVNRREPTQVILYYFDRANVNFIKENIITTVKQEIGSTIAISESNTIDLMVEVYNKELIHNRIHDVEQTISKMNLNTIKNGIKLGHSQTAIEKYRQNVDKVRVCHYPMCTKVEKKVMTGSTV